jgi:HlyD family secretion protein
LNLPSNPTLVPAPTMNTLQALIAQRPRAVALAAAVLLAGGTVTALAVRAADKAAPAVAAAAKPALTVTTVAPQRQRLALALPANGSIAAWQEASVGAEANGLRLAEVRVNVGDVVKKGQVLASFSAEMVQAEAAQGQAAVAEAEAALADAAANAQRARELQASGALSAQQISQLLTAERTAQARLDALRAALQAQKLRLAHTQVLAPDAGVISARNATVGAVVPAGAELFRLIRGGRLEWRAEVPAADLAGVRAGQPVRVSAPGVEPVAGRVRMVAPTVDAATRNGTVYVDLPQAGALKAGMFARGEFETGSAEALTVPATAVVMRDGFSYVWRVGADSRVVQTKVDTGRRSGERIEIRAGLDAGARVVASGGGFLADGDTVKVVDAAPPVLPPVKPAANQAKAG